MRVARAFLRLFALFTASGAMLAWMVVSPPTTVPAAADAVVLLSGDGGRLPEALHLMDLDVAPTLVFVGEPDILAVVDLCRDAQRFEVVCLKPSPDTTQTEAQATGELARARRWKSIVLVTSRYHLTRARLLFNRCFDGTVYPVGDPPRYGPSFARRQIVHEWLGLVHATFLARGC